MKRGTDVAIPLGLSLLTNRMFVTVALKMDAEAEVLLCFLKVNVLLKAQPVFSLPQAPMYH